MYSIIAKSASSSAKSNPSTTIDVEKPAADTTPEGTKDTDKPRVDGEEDESLEHNPRVKWCFDNKAAILALHSSDEHSKIFEM